MDKPAHPTIEELLISSFHLNGGVTSKPGADEEHQGDQEENRSSVTPIERPLMLDYINKLTPPPGTNFWHHQTFNVLTNQELRSTILGINLLLCTLTWNIDAYVYVVNAKPGSDFAKRGGFVYIVLIHSGAAATGTGTAAGMEYSYTVTMKSPPSGTTALKQLPPSNSGVVSGDSTNYKISFTQDMQMFRNGGNELFTFPAQYEDSLDLHKGQQMGFVRDNQSTRWGVQFDPAPPALSNFPFSSMSVFRLPSLDQVTFECQALVIGASQTQSITVDCRF